MVLVQPFCLWGLVQVSPFGTEQIIVLHLEDSILSMSSLKVQQEQERWRSAAAVGGSGLG